MIIFNVPSKHRRRVRGMEGCVRFKNEVMRQSKFFKETQNLYAFVIAIYNGIHHYKATLFCYKLNFQIRSCHEFVVLSVV